MRNTYGIIVTVSTVSICSANAIRGLTCGHLLPRAPQISGRPWRDACCMATTLLPYDMSWHLPMAKPRPRPLRGDHVWLGI